MERLMMLMVLLALLLTACGSDGEREPLKQQISENRPHCVTVWQGNWTYVCDVFTPAGTHCVVVTKWRAEGGAGISCDWGQQ